MTLDVVCLLLGDYRGFDISLVCKFILYDVKPKNLREGKYGVIFHIAALGYFCTSRQR